MAPEVDRKLPLRRDSILNGLLISLKHHFRAKQSTAVPFSFFNLTKTSGLFSTITSVIPNW
jgi:hypothetical protein